MAVHFLKQECGICLEMQFAVTRLSCTHAMCQICFAKLSTVNDGIITCPFCRKVVETKNESNIKREISHKIQCSSCEQYLDGFHMWLCDICLVFVCTTCQLKLKAHTNVGCSCTEYDIDSVKRMCAAYVRLVFSPFLEQRSKNKKDDLQYAVYLSLSSEFDKLVSSIGEFELPDLSHKSDTLLRKPQSMLAHIKICLQYANYCDGTDIELSPLMEQILLHTFQTLTFGSTTTSSAVKTQTDEKAVRYIAESTSIAVQTSESIVAENKESKPSVVQDLPHHHSESNFEIELPAMIKHRDIKIVETRQYYCIFYNMGGNLLRDVIHKGTQATSTLYVANGICCDAKCRDYFNDTITVLYGDRLARYFELYSYDLVKMVEKVPAHCSRIGMVKSHEDNKDYHAILSRSGNCVIEIPSKGPLHCHLIEPTAKYQLESHVLPREAHVYAMDASTDKLNEIVVFGVNGMLQCGKILKKPDRTCLFFCVSTLMRGIKKADYSKIRLVFRCPRIYVLMNRSNREQLLIFDIETGNSPDSNLTIVANTIIDNIPIIMTEPGEQEYLTTVLIKDNGKKLMFKRNNLNLQTVINV